MEVFLLIVVVAIALLLMFLPHSGKKKWAESHRRGLEEQYAPWSAPQEEKEPEDLRADSDLEPSEGFCNGTRVVAQAVFRVAKTTRGWALFDGKKTILTRKKKRDAVAEARSVANARQPSRLEIYKADGECQVSHEYGKSKG